MDRTLSRIEAALVRGGATNVAKDYDGGVLVALMFSTVDPGSGRRMSVRLPANAEGVYEALLSKVSRPRAGTVARLRDQASRTAWKLMQDWVEVQMSLIEMRQADFLQVFLPYVWDGHKTFYQALKGNGFKMLPEGKS